MGGYEVCNAVVVMVDILGRDGDEKEVVSLQVLES